MFSSREIERLDGCYYIKVVAVFCFAPLRNLQMSVWRADRVSALRSPSGFHVYRGAHLWIPLAHFLLINYYTTLFN